MSLDTALDAALDPTAEAAATEPTAEAAAPTTPEPAPAAPQARTYTQDEMDRAAAWYRKSLKEERERIERELRSERPEPKAEPDQNQKWLEQVIEAKMQERLAPIQAKEVSRDLDAAVAALTSSHAELSDDKRLNEVLDTVIELGLDKATHLTVEQALEVAYRYWRQVPDIDAIKKQAADEAIKTYTTKKVETASKTPKTEGSGTGAVTPAKKITKVSDMDAALEAALARIE